ncbi:hypothetical protein ACIGO8_06500 [Streptomyces sp. NPDC053493]|uniref:hypothetical protein n=1 Tax=Streptomyces sp. NPDC053493 TaxID=3365705 RepID=UPI0037D5D441
MHDEHLFTLATLAPGGNMRHTGPARLAAAAAVALLGALGTACTSSPDPAPATSSAPPAPHHVTGKFMADLVGGTVVGAVGQLEGSMRVEDVSGQGRIVPMNAPDWKICTQDPAPGAALDGQEIVLGAVKTNEDC